MQENNARLRCFGNYMPVRDIEIVDAKQKIWKGIRVIEVGTPEGVMEWVFFSRNYRPDVNDYDNIAPELHITDNDIMGFEFWLVQKEKILFGYDPHSPIAKPSIKLVKGPMGMS